MNIGKKIKTLRRAKGLTQEELASSINISFQAISKWENNISLPDITMMPILASFFGVSIDELFDHSLKEIEEKALEIAKESWKYRGNDDKKARDILLAGLNDYPNNDILLSNLLYVIDYSKNPDATIKVASKVVDVTKNDSIRYDAYRFMAYAYKSKDDLESARASLNQIPEIYFSKLSEEACILTGEEKWLAACREEGQALYTLMLMKEKIAESCIEKWQYKEALKEYEQALAVLDVLEANDNWNEWREAFKKYIEEIKPKIH
ncbi:MAG: helix-turn-helix transcriptional regulator [Clostridia bacterium]|nr:helix-turn-helix transcriptional regulator [Clostridia bacterium]